MDIDPIRYPIGKFEAPDKITTKDVNNWLAEIEKLPSRLVVTVNPLNDMQLDTPYREGGWTVRQTIHHIADFHINNYFRFKLCLTESHPVVKHFRQEAWAELMDAKTAPVEPSLLILEGLLGRWSVLLRGLSHAELQKTFSYDGQKGEISLEKGLGICSWHGRHHLQQITNLVQRSGWLPSWHV